MLFASRIRHAFSRSAIDVRLKPMPDGFGFIYGDAADAKGETRRIKA
jgi:hypothetical protein